MSKLPLSIEAVDANFGGSWRHPIWIGKWRIYRSDEPLWNLRWSFVHDDYDGTEDAYDNRAGCAVSVAKCLEMIAEMEDE